MKKIMWIVAVLPVVVASMMLQVIPDMIPLYMYHSMHA